MTKGKWTPAEDEFLLRIFKEQIPELKQSGAVPYHLISSKYLPHRTSKQIKERWENVLNPNLRKGKWSSGEIKQLFKLLIKYGQSWAQIHEEFETRSFHCIKSKGRYLLGEIVRPGLKGKRNGSARSYLTKEEEKRLLKTHKMYGYDKDKMCYQLGFQLSCAELERKLISICQCAHCKERFERLNDADVSFKTAWTKDKAAYLLEEHLKGNLKDDDLINTKSTCFAIKIEPDESQCLDGCDIRSELSTMAGSQPDVSEFCSGGCGVVEHPIKKEESVSDEEKFAPLEETDFDLVNIYEDLREAETAGCDKRKREDYHVDRLEKKMKALEAERIQASLLEAAKSVEVVGQKTTSYRNVIARVMNSFYNEEQLLAFCRAAADSKIEWFSPSIAYLLDQTVEWADDPRYDLHFCFPEKASFDESRAIASLLYDVDTCLCVNETENMSTALGLPTHLDTHWFYNQPSILHATYLLTHMFSRLSEEGVVWMRQRKIKRNGQQGIYLVRVVHGESTCQFDYQDVSSQFPKLLQMPLELI